MMVPRISSCERINVQFRSNVYGEPHNEPVFKLVRSSGQFLRDRKSSSVTSPKQCTHSGSNSFEKQKLKWFRGPKGCLLSTKVRLYVQTELSNRTRWGLCNVNNSNNVGGLKNLYCAQLVMYHYVMMQKSFLPVDGTSSIMMKIYISALIVEWSRAAAEKTRPPA